MKKKIFSLAMLGMISAAAFAQSGTNSPYSQYGLGVLSDQSQGFNRGMNGLSLGLRRGNQVNVLNPASYSTIDSLTMIIDAGMSGQITNFEEGGKKLNANNADFEYVVASFRLQPKMGLSLGLLPYTNVGYNYSSTSNVGTPAPGTAPVTSLETHSGSGGIHQALVGFGWEPLKNLSFGVNFSYLWGTYTKSVAVASSDVYADAVSRVYETTVSSYKLDLGLQYQYNLDKSNAFVLGATYGLGHGLNGDATLTMSTVNNQTGVSSTGDYVVEDAMSIPHTFGVGMSWTHKNSLLVGVDYSMQKWGELDHPEVDYNNKDIYVLKSGLLSDRHKVTVGAEWLPNGDRRKFYNRIYYRIGASYATPYIKVNGQDGPKEYSVSAGFGIPIMNGWNNRSILNISGQWTRNDATGFVKENTFRINLGLTFNERWFAKWKVN